MLMGEFTGQSNFREATARVSGDPAELGYQLTLVQELLRRLNPAEREVVLLLGPCGFTPAEVAGMQGCSERAVIQKAYRARKKLEQMVPDGALPFLVKYKAAAAEGGATGAGKSSVTTAPSMS